MNQTPQPTMQMSLVKPANSVYLAPELISLIDRAMNQKGGYSSRAEFVRDCVRSASFKIISEASE